MTINIDFRIIYLRKVGIVMEEIAYLEEQLNINIDLLKIAKDYCEFNNDNISSTSSLLSLLDIVLENQKIILSKLDKLEMIAPIK